MLGYKGSSMISKCGSYNLLGGYNVCGKGCVITNKYESINPVYSYQLTFMFMMVDSWDNGEFFIITINENEAYRESKVKGSKDLCGFATSEDTQSANFEYKTSDQIINVKFINNMDENPDTESIGISEFIIYANECMAECLECTDATTCSKCKEGKYLDASRCIDCIANCEKCTKKDSCDLCKNGYFYNDFQCVSVCPNNKYKNVTTRTCHDCDNKCKTCSDATDCDTCLQNRVAPACGCPDYNYDNLNYQQACFACSDISVGCSTCDNKTCQACLAPRFLDGNSCLNPCPAGKWGNTANRQCENCLAKCATCSNATIVTLAFRIELHLIVDVLLTIMIT
ncbi:zinc finger lsd1 subclass family protein, putative [Ichthyophthirius multifiliis]|uniref:Zinc finger lsd1 subclass family protein, putative n=1 Tax=Ichthyophthirius multifiliis TaxID=5932 RepID=G0QWB0_ICHMU|nr:zinc finger lsd1 subclass family protein, putative [Ichthyophthirius multifiliis]EGR30495.1 zinc finger lsd1 subclass family protein, putative [Ichthyophthirius multifiliis]|eukprot:XP_004032082.1 zinc finger lsd1 subclass family protein, putative [Ichthyophthirius multifiliis]